MAHSGGMTKSASEQLEEFIFHPDPYRAENVPEGLHQVEVAAFIETHIGWSTDFRPLLQTEKVIDRYQLQAVCPYYKELLNNRVSETAGLLRIIVLARSVALACPADGVFVAELFGQLVPGATTSQEFQELIWLGDSLDSAADMQLLQTAIGKRMEAISARRAADYQVQLEYWKLEELLNLRVARSIKPSPSSNLCWTLRIGTNA